MTAAQPAFFNRIIVVVVIMNFMCGLIVFKRRKWQIEIVLLTASIFFVPEKVMGALPKLGTRKGGKRAIRVWWVSYNVILSIMTAMCANEIHHRLNRQRQDYVDVKGEYQSTSQRNKNYLRQENKANKEHNPNQVTCTCFVFALYSVMIWYQSIVHISCRITSPALYLCKTTPNDICIYIYIYMCVCIYVYAYAYAHAYSSSRGCLRG